MPRGGGTPLTPMAQPSQPHLVTECPGHRAIPSSTNCPNSLAATFSQVARTQFKLTHWLANADSDHPELLWLPAAARSVIHSAAARCDGRQSSSAVPSREAASATLFTAGTAELLFLYVPHGWDSRATFFVCSTRLGQPSYFAAVTRRYKFRRLGHFELVEQVARWQEKGGVLW